MKTLSCLLFLILVNASCATAQSQEFHWLLGTWKTTGGNVYEVWTIRGGTSELLGKSFILKNGDTTLTESISLKRDSNGFHYIPDVAGDQPPIDFRITSYDNSGFVAENPLHDFPKLIRYRYNEASIPERIDASIEGDGKVTSYAFVKVK